MIPVTRIDGAYGNARNNRTSAADPLWLALPKRLHLGVAGACSVGRKGLLETPEAVPFSLCRLGMRLFNCVALRMPSVARRFVRSPAGPARGLHACPTGSHRGPHS